MLDRLAARYGRRGTWLIVIGSVWLVVGLSILGDPLPTHSWVAYQYAPQVLQATAWWITGGVAIAQGLRGAKVHDYVGHVALYFMPAVRAISFALSWLIWVATSTLSHFGVFHTIGWADGWYAALVWFLVSLMLRLIADWPNPSQPIPHPPADAAERA